MIIFLFIIPVLAVLSAFFLYRQNGKKQFMRFDLVQFFYAFVIAPAMFVWCKVFIFVLLKPELNTGPSYSTLLFTIDTIITVFFLYIFAFVVIHSLTKTFELKVKRDPFYDIFADSERFHLNLTHFPIYIGSMITVTVLSMINVPVAIAGTYGKTLSFFTFGLGLFTGLLGFLSLWLYYRLPDPYFMRIMKLCFAFFFLLHLVVFFVADPVFSFSHGVYWFAFAFYLMTVILSLFAEDPKKRRRTFRKIPFALNWRKPKYYFKSMRKLLSK